MISARPTAADETSSLEAVAEPVGEKKAGEGAADVVDDVTGLSPKQRGHLESMLKVEREKVRTRRMSHVSDATDDSEVALADELDQAARDAEQAYLLKLADNERKLLMEIDHALAKFPHGTYGVCEGTGEPIGYRRLEARPWARHSVEYKEMLERDRGPRG